jgi:hypothetical protein
MGVLLSKPNTEKVFEEGTNGSVTFAACSMQVIAATRMCRDLMPNTTAKGTRPRRPVLSLGQY